MRKQNYLSAFLMLFLSLSCLIAGYWVGYDERRELAQMVTDNVISQQKAFRADTANDLNFLIALQEGNTELLIRVYTQRVKFGLKPNQLIGHQHIDYLSSFSDAREETKTKALQYQLKYCSDKCLGL